MGKRNLTGRFIVEAGEMKISSYAIGAGTEVNIEDTSSHYTVTSNSSNTLWQNLQATLVGNKLSGSLSDGTPFTIRQGSSAMQIVCSYQKLKSETGSWTADDEGIDPET